MIQLCSVSVNMSALQLLPWLNFILLAWCRYLPLGQLTDEDSQKKGDWKMHINEVESSIPCTIHPDPHIHIHMQKYTCNHTPPGRNWLQLGCCSSLFLVHQHRSESPIIKKAFLMTEGLTVSDAGTLWYSRGNPTYLLRNPTSQSLPFLFVISLLVSLKMCRLYGNETKMKIKVTCCYMIMQQPEFNNLFWISLEVTALLCCALPGN